MSKRQAIMRTASLAGFLLIFAFASYSHAELSLEDTMKLLQEGLTISEIDREVERLSAQELAMNEEIVQTESSILLASDKVEATREHAGRVLRSYYMGERDSLWLLLLRANSFVDALSVYQYLQVIAESDRHAIDRHTTAYQQLQELHAMLLQQRTELVEVKQAFLEQRDRVAKLQAELDQKLAEQANRDELIAQIEQLNNEWRTNGLPVFRQFLQAMTDAMANLSEYLLDNENALEAVDRKNFLFHIEEDALNRFLREQDDVFEQFKYALTNEHIIITGKLGNTAIEIKGHYEIQHEPEEALRFMLDELIYNAFTLPDTTRLEMQQQFKMTFYPAQHPLTSIMTFSAVELQQGVLTIGVRLP